MLLLMRREGEVIRINGKVVIEIKEIHPDSVTFQVIGLNEENPIKKNENNEEV